jgi:hypothetical protein
LRKFTNTFFPEPLEVWSPWKILVERHTQIDMRLNLKKTKEMVIDLRIMKSEIPVITIDNTPIERVQSPKLLGIWLQSDLKWHTIIPFLLLKRPGNAYIF